MKLSRLYPGSIWFKRFGYLLLIYSIGTNCFLGKVQNRIINSIDKTTDEMNPESLLEIAKKLPDLSNLKIDEGSKTAKVLDFMIEGATKNINSYAVLSSNIDSKAEETSSNIKFIKKSLKTVLFVVTITGNLIWISIIWALIWLYFDIRKGNARGFVKKGLLFSIPFNIATFYLLSKYVLEAIVSN